MGSRPRFRRSRACRLLPSSDAPPTDLFASAGGTIGTGSRHPVRRTRLRPDPPAFTQSPGRDGGGGTLLVASPRFKLQYAVDDAGPNGPATVELWITQDGGRTWIRRGDDPDRVSPIEVDLGGEGTYGLMPGGTVGIGTGRSAPRAGRSASILGRGGQHTAGRPAPAAPGRHRRQLRQGGDRLAGQRPSPAAQVGLASPGGPTRPVPTGRRSPRLRRTPVNSSGPFRRLSRSGSISRSRPSTPSAITARRKRPTWARSWSIAAGRAAGSSAWTPTPASGIGPSARPLR